MQSELIRRVSKNLFTNLWGEKLWAPHLAFWTSHWQGDCGMGGPYYTLVRVNMKVSDSAFVRGDGSGSMMFCQARNVIVEQFSVLLGCSFLDLWLERVDFYWGSLSMLVVSGLLASPEPNLAQMKQKQSPRDHHCYSSITRSLECLSPSLHLSESS